MSPKKLAELLDWYVKMSPSVPINLKKVDSFIIGVSLVFFTVNTSEIRLE